MSRVYLIAADKPLPLYDCRSMRTRSARGGSITMECGFAVEEHAYYRTAVDDLGYGMKPFRYELQLDDAAEDLPLLREYLSAQFSPGESVELWSLWLGGGETRPKRYRGAFAEFDRDTVEMLLEEGQTCLTILI